MSYGYYTHHKNLLPHCTLMPNYFQLSFFIRTTFLVNFYSKLFPTLLLPFCYFLFLKPLSSFIAMYARATRMKKIYKKKGKTLSKKRKKIKFIEESGE